MRLEVHALASGSSGNAVLIKADGRAILIDAGLSGRLLMGGLRARGIGAGCLDAILLTHEHDDHLRGCSIVSERTGCAVVANRATLDAASYRAATQRELELETGGQLRIGAFTVQSFAVSHDAAEPVGYVVEVGGSRIAYATDTGRSTRGLREALRGANLCILESNHDLGWLLRGPYPPLMKLRVASDRGHLSNGDAAAILAERLEECGPTTIWLAHLSKVNNSPALARKFAMEAISSQTRIPFHLQVALRDRPSVTWTPGSQPLQPSLF